MSHPEWLFKDYLWPSNGIEEDPTTSVNENGRFTPALQRSESVPTAYDQNFHNLSSSLFNAPRDQTDMPLETTYRDPTGIFDGNENPSTALRYWDPISLTWHQAMPNLSDGFANAPTISWYEGTNVNSPLNAMHEATLPIRQISGYETNHYQPWEHEYRFATNMQARPFNTSSIFLEHVWEQSDTLFRAALQPNQTNTLPFRQTWICDWVGCSRTEPFRRKGDLTRHRVTQHLFPGAYQCPDCGKRCNRPDNLEAHRRNVHRQYSQR